MVIETQKESNGGNDKYSCKDRTNNQNLDEGSMDGRRVERRGPNQMQHRDNQVEGRQSEPKAHNKVGGCQEAT